MAIYNVLLISNFLILILLGDCKINSGNYVKLPTNGTDATWPLYLEPIVNVGNMSLSAAAKCVTDPLCFYYCKTTDANNKLVAYRYNYNAPATNNINGVNCYMVPRK